MYPDEGNRVLLGVDAPEGVFAVQVLDEVFADDLVEFIGPVFVGGVGAHHKEEVDVVFAEQEGVAVEETIFELFLNVFLEVVVGLELRVGVVDLTVGDSVTDEEVGRDVVALGEGIAEALEFFASEFHVQRYGVAIAELVEFLDTDCFLQVEFLDVVLDGVAGVGELLVQRDAGDVVGVFVVLAITDEVYVRVAAGKGTVEVDVVDNLVVVLVFEFIGNVLVAEQFVDHRLEDDVEVAHDKEVTLLLVSAAIVLEESVEEFPQLAKILAEVAALVAFDFLRGNAAADHRAHFRRRHDGVDKVAEAYLEVVFLLQVVENRVEEDDEFLVGVEFLLLVDGLNVHRLLRLLVDVRLSTGDGALPGGVVVPAVVLFGNGGEDGLVILEEVHELHRGAEEVFLAGAGAGAAAAEFRLLDDVGALVLVVEAADDLMHPDGKAGDFADDVGAVQGVLRGFQVNDLLGHGLGDSEEGHFAAPFQQQGFWQDEDGAVVFLPVIDVANIARLDLIIAHLQHLPEVFFKKMWRVLIIFKVDAHRCRRSGKWIIQRSARLLPRVLQLAAL